MAALRGLMAARNLTDLWLVTPDWLFWRVIDRMKIEKAAVHEVLCEAFGCRCG